MICIRLHNGDEILQPETPEEWLAMQPEAKLRDLFAGDVAGTLRFHDRLLDLDRRWDSFWSRIGTVAA